MKSKLILGLGICVAIAFSSCSKMAKHQQRVVIIENKSIEVVLNSGDLYELNLASYGADTKKIATISTQATNFAISKIDQTTASTNYLYKPSVAANNDVVVLTIAEENVGKCDNRDVKSNSSGTCGFGNNPNSNNGIAAGGCIQNEADIADNKHQVTQTNLTIHFTIDKSINKVK